MLLTLIIRLMKHNSQAKDPCALEILYMVNEAFQTSGERTAYSVNINLTIALYLGIKLEINLATYIMVILC